MSPDIFIVGTNHRYQYGSDNTRFKCSVTDVRDFTEFLRQLCATHGLKGIAEEMTLESMKRWGGGREISTPQELANSLSIPHWYIEPDIAESKREGIPSDESILLREQFECLSKRQTRFLFFDQYLKREKFWLKRIVEQNTWPILVVCGSIHSNRFCRLCKDSQFHVRIVVKDWMSSRPK